MMANSWQLTERNKIQIFWSRLPLILLRDLYFCLFVFPKCQFQENQISTSVWPEWVVWSLVTYCLMDDVLMSDMYKDGVSDLKPPKAWFGFQECICLAQRKDTFSGEEANFGIFKKPILLNRAVETTSGINTLEALRPNLHHLRPAFAWLSKLRVASTFLKGCKPTNQTNKQTQKERLMCSTNPQIVTIRPFVGKVCLSLNYTMKVKIYQFYFLKLALEKQ